MLALPSYAVPILNGGVSTMSLCSPGIAQLEVLFPLKNRPPWKVGQMTIDITGIKLSSGIDNPLLKNFEWQAPVSQVTPQTFDCPRLVGFSRIPIGGTIQVATFQVTRPYLTNQYFDIGNGLAMKVEVGDSPSSLATPTQGNGKVITLTTNDRAVEKVGVALKATLKVMGKVEPRNFSVEIGTFSYKVTSTVSQDYETAYAPITFNIKVQEGDIRSCTLANANSVFNLLKVGKSGLDIPGTELQGGEITVGPVNCPKDVEVKVNFFDNATAAIGSGLTSYLRTVYSDDNTPSQYALKFYPVDGGAPLKFLPRTQLQEGWGPVANATAVNFTQGLTTAQTSVQKNYTVKYIKTTNAGSDRPGPIKGIMTVQFLYY